MCGCTPALKHFFTEIIHSRGSWVPIGVRMCSWHKGLPAHLVGNHELALLKLCGHGDELSRSAETAFADSALLTGSFFRP